MFITFEGIDGAGKSSHIEPLAVRLRDLGFVVVVTREPGGTPLAEQLRALILSAPMDTLTETLLAFAARRDHLNQVICPALERGEIVLCDRFTDSTFAYQGGGRGLSCGAEIICQLERWVQLDSDKRLLVEPDITLWFDVEPSVAAARLSEAREPDRFESQSLKFFERVRAVYLDRMHHSNGRIVRLDASQAPELVLNDVLRSIPADLLEKSVSN